jgi:hypothetical protein
MRSESLIYPLSRKLNPASKKGRVDCAGRNFKRFAGAIIFEQRENPADRSNMPNPAKRDDIA